MLWRSPASQPVKAVAFATPATNVASIPALVAADTANAKTTRSFLRGCKIIKASARNSAGTIGRKPSRMHSADKDQIA